jgi:hypothetical protein
VDCGDLLAAVPARVVERELEDPACARDRDRLDRDAGVAVAQLPALRLDPADELLGLRGALLVLDAGIGSSVFSRMMTRSTSSKRERTPG